MQHQMVLAYGLHKDYSSKWICLKYRNNTLHPFKLTITLL